MVIINGYYKWLFLMVIFNEKMVIIDGYYLWLLLMVIMNGYY